MGILSYSASQTGPFLQTPAHTEDERSDRDNWSHALRERAQREKERWEKHQQRFVFRHGGDALHHWNCPSDLSASWTILSEEWMNATEWGREKKKDAQKSAPTQYELNYSGFSHGAENEWMKQTDLWNQDLHTGYQLWMPKAESDSFSLIIFPSINAQLQKHFFIISFLLF